MGFLHRTWAEIDIAALIHNFKIIKNACQGSKIMSVVKADAYGHSVKDVAPVLDKLGTDSFAVSNIDEAIQLRQLGINKPVLILGYTPPQLAGQLYSSNITQTVYCEEYAKKLSENAEAAGIKVNVHIKLDTGMGRLGFNVRNNLLPEFDNIVNVFSYKGLNVTGTYTHFSVADCPESDNKDYTESQFDRFNTVIERLNSLGHNTGLIHCCNSAGVSLGSDYHLNMCRPGIILYGLRPSDSVDFNGQLKPVMTVKSVISMVKTIAEGDCVSYGRTFTAKGNMRVATVTAGYADGYPRLLSNLGYVLINGQRAKIIGRICMDQFIIDVTNIPSASEGDEVILFGKDLLVDELAEKCGTINYEIICGISPRVPRVIINNLKEY
ncbi:MAG: alanine racemase [Clostridia bacterium]|nr:alanine racemase [Clostridia bacterium]